MKKKIILGLILSMMFVFMVPIFTSCSNKEPRLVNVTWCNDDHTVIMQEQYHVGDIPKYKGTLPTSAESESDMFVTYVFSYWTDWYSDIEVNIQNDEFGFQPVPDHDVKYVARYTPTNTKYSFQFKNYNGEVLLNINDALHRQFTKVNLENTPKKPAQGNFIYIFKGWDTDFEDFWQSECQNYINGPVKVVNAVYKEVDITKNTDGLQFTLNDSETAYYVSGYNGTEKDIVISSTYNNKPVEGITYHAIHNEEIESVYIAEGIKYIKDGAFYNSDRIKYVSLPNSLESITTNSFRECRGIEFTTENDCEYLGNDSNPYLVLYRATQDNETYDINSNTKVIATQIFGQSHSNLKTLVIPEGVRAIPNSMCSSNQTLESVTIPSTVKVIGSHAFYCCENLSTVIMNGAIEKIEEYAFRNCTSLTEINFNEGLKEIDYAFEGCTGLTQISLPNSIELCKESFGDAQESAFTKEGNAYYLGNAQNPYLALARLDDNTELTITPKTKLALCKVGVTTLNYDGTLDEWYEFAPRVFNDELYGNYFQELYFKNEKLQGEIVIPSTITKITKSMFKSQTEITNVVIPNTVTIISDYAFDGCSSLTSVVMPDSVEFIGYGSFENCTSLANIKLSNNLKYIGYWAFSNTSLSEILIPSSVEEINGDAFRGCKSLTSVVIPNSVKIIGSAVFYECSNLKNLLIPSSVKKIGSLIVSWTSNDLKVYYNGTKEQYDQIQWSFESDKLDNIIYVPTLSNLMSAVQNNNYSLEINSLAYDFDGEKILFNSNIYVKENNQFVGYTLVTENNKVRFDNIGTLDLSAVAMLKDSISNYVFTDDEFEISFVDDCLAFVSDKTLDVNGVEISSRVIKLAENDYYVSLVVDGNKYEALVTNLNKNKIYTPTDNEVSLYFMAMDYYNNFTQVNVVHMTNPMDLQDYGNGVNYKVDGNKVYLEQTSYSSSKTTTNYLSKEDDNYYNYQYYNGQWYKTQISEETYNKNKSSVVSDDTRILLFDGSNYTKNGDVYNYTGETVYFESGGDKFIYENITLTIDGDVLTISFSIYGGFITGTYTFSNVNTTKITLPVVA